MKKSILLVFLIALFVKGYSQCKDCKDGKHNGLNYSATKSKEISKKALPPDSTGGLAQSYILQNVCGLNWQQSSVKTTTRYPTPPGTGIPSVVPLTFSSCNVDSVVKAYLYFTVLTKHLFRLILHR